MQKKKRAAFKAKLPAPDMRALYYAVLVFWSLISVYAGFLFTLKGAALKVFMYAWFAVPAAFSLYVFYGYGRLAALRIKKAVRCGGFVNALKTDRAFRSGFATAAGIIISFTFAAFYCAQGIITLSGFYWFLAEFYLVAAVLKLYLNTVAGTPPCKNGDIAYIIVYCVSVLLAVAIAGATFYVVFFDGIFEKNGYLVAFISLFALYKICAAIYSFHKARKQSSRLDSAKSLAELASAMFSVFTLCVALMIMITKNPLMKHFSYLGFGFAAVIFVMSVTELVKSCICYVKNKKRLTAR